MRPRDAHQARTSAAHAGALHAAAERQLLLVPGGSLALNSVAWFVFARVRGYAAEAVRKRNCRLGLLACLTGILGVPAPSPSGRRRASAPACRSPRPRPPPPPGGEPTVARASGCDRAAAPDKLHQVLVRVVLRQGRRGGGTSSRRRGGVCSPRVVSLRSRRPGGGGALSGREARERRCVPHCREIVGVGNPLLPATCCCFHLRARSVRWQARSRSRGRRRLRVKEIAR